MAESNHLLDEAAETDLLTPCWDENIVTKIQAPNLIEMRKGSKSCVSTDWYVYHYQTCS